MPGDVQPNLSDIPKKRLIAKARRLVKQRATLLTELGLIIGELNRRGDSYRDIGAALEAAWQSVYRWHLLAMEKANAPQDAAPDPPEGSTPV